MMSYYDRQALTDFRDSQNYVGQGGNSNSLLILELNSTRTFGIPAGFIFFSTDQAVARTIGPEGATSFMVSAQAPGTASVIIHSLDGREAREIRVVVVADLSTPLMNAITAIAPTITDPLCINTDEHLNPVRVGRLDWQVTSNPTLSASQLAQLRAAVVVTADQPGFTITTGSNARTFGEVLYSGDGFTSLQHPVVITFTFALATLPGVSEASTASLTAEVAVTPDGFPKTQTYRFDADTSFAYTGIPSRFRGMAITRRSTDTTYTGWLPLNRSLSSTTIEPRQVIFAALDLPNRTIITSRDVTRTWRGQGSGYDTSQGFGVRAICGDAVLPNILWGSVFDTPVGSNVGSRSLVVWNTTTRRSPINQIRIDVPPPPVGNFALDRHAITTDATHIYVSDPTNNPPMMRAYRRAGTATAPMPVRDEAADITLTTDNNDIVGATIVTISTGQEILYVMDLGERSGREEYTIFAYLRPGGSRQRNLETYRIQPTLASTVRDPDFPIYALAHDGTHLWHHGQLVRQMIAYPIA